MKAGTERIAYLDCFSGLSGDMFLGALVGAGLPLEDLERELRKAGLSGYRLVESEVKRGGISAKRVQVEIRRGGRRPVGLPEILRRITQSRLPRSVKIDAVAVFWRLAKAEARVHGTRVSKVHFHELGAIDAQVDIVGAACGLHLLGIRKLFSSALPVSRGWVRSEHGRLPVPAPATAALLEGFPVVGADLEGELVTPTGAALATTLCEGFGACPEMRLERVSYGAGTRDWKDRPNLLRMLVGQMPTGAPAEGPLWMLETNLDDINPEIVGYLSEFLLRQGALDVFSAPVQMKKSRPGILLSVLTRERDLESLERSLFTESTTFGIRRYRVERSVLERETVRVRIPYGHVRVKLGMENGKVLSVAPEYEDCRSLAERTGRPLKEIYDHARQAYHQLSTFRERHPGMRRRGAEEQGSGGQKP